MSTKTSESLSSIKASQPAVDDPESSLFLPCPLPLPHEPVHTWPFLINSIQTNTLGDLHRSPSQFAAYEVWVARTRLQYGSVPNFILRVRLQWEPVEEVDGVPEFDVQNVTPFASKQDYKTLRNDWPYGLEHGVVHLCVWLKNRLNTDDREAISSGSKRRGKLTREARNLVETFVEEKFTKAVRHQGKDIAGQETKFDWESSSNGGGDGLRVLWFKNWTELQSVRGIDHIHVLLRGATDTMVRDWLEE